MEKRKNGFLFFFLVFLCEICMLGSIFNLKTTKTKAEETSLYVPQFATNWKRSTHLVGDGGFYSDFAIFQDGIGHWHAIGIGGPNAEDKSYFYKAVSATERTT